MAKKKHLFAVERENGFRVVEAEISVAKIGDVEFQHMDNGLVRLLHNGDVVKTGDAYTPDGVKLTLVYE